MCHNIYVLIVVFVPAQWCFGCVNMAREIKLNNGIVMPAIGLGTWQMDEAEAEKSVKEAIDLGYRHFDTAYIYHNEVGVGKAIRQKIKEGVIKREDVFVTSKLWNTFHARKHVLPACQKSHRYLSVDYIDLYLVHWPFGVKSEKDSRNPQVFDEFDNTSLEDTWREMERCVDEGLVRSIGLSNFNSVQLVRILNIARIKPVTNQVELHVGLHQKDLIRFCQERDVIVTGYCPLGAPDRPVKRKETIVLEQPAVLQLAAKYGKTPGQVALRYVVQLGAVPIPKATKTGHLKDNLNIFDFTLKKEEMDKLDKLNTNDRIMLYPLTRHHVEWPFNIPF